MPIRRCARQGLRRSGCGPQVRAPPGGPTSSPANATTSPEGFGLAGLLVHMLRSLGVQMYAHPGLARQSSRVTNATPCNTGGAAGSGRGSGSAPLHPVHLAAWSRSQTPTCGMLRTLPVHGRPKSRPNKNTAFTQKMGETRGLKLLHAKFQCAFGPCTDASRAGSSRLASRSHQATRRCSDLSRMFLSR